MVPSLLLQNFRNHRERLLELAPHTVITGPNGSGKTSVLEAVAMLSVTTSWKAERDSEVVAWDAPFARLVSGDHEFVVQRAPYYKRIRIDGVSKRAGEVLGRMPSVIFQPEDSVLVGGTPAYRRQTLDRLFSQAHSEYARALSQYQKVLKQRNKLLKLIQEGNASMGELSYWNQQLAAAAEQVKALRATAIPVLAATVAKVFQGLVPEGGSVSIAYHHSPRESSRPLIEHITAHQERDVAAGATLSGPHREDIEFLWGGRPAGESMSRGQVRALVIAFKVAELRYIQAATGSAPILLLDDIFSEFDQVRRERVLALTAGCQTIMTVTDLSTVQGKMPSDTQVIAL